MTLAEKRPAPRRRLRSVKDPARPAIPTFERLVAKPPDSRRVIALVRAGLPALALAQAVEYLEVPQGELLAALRIPVSSFHRKVAEGKALSAEESEKLLRLGEVARCAQATFGGVAAAKEWLTTQNAALGATPLSLMDTEAGAGQVRRVLATLDYGGVA